MRRQPVEIIAHRAGNSAESVAAAARLSALGVVDTVELDVHLFRGRLEVRHAKIVCWPFARLWERWELLPADAPRCSLRGSIDAIPSDLGVWIDLKGFTRRLPRAVHRSLGDRPDVTYSSRQWWLLRWVRRHTAARTMVSVGSRWQRWVVVTLGTRADGIVVADRLVDREWFDRLSAVAAQIVVWGVDDPERARSLTGWGVRGLVLDDPTLVVPGVR